MSLLENSLPALQFERELEYIDVNDIDPNPNNPREKYSRKEVADLRESIRTTGGVLVPIVVYKEGNRFVLIEGERRWRACKQLSKKDPQKFLKIPANVIQKPLTPIENLQTMFNIHQMRKEWSTAAKAEAVGNILKLKGKLNVSQLIELTGLNRTSVNDALLFLRFSKQIRKRCLDGELDEFYPILLGRNLKSIEKVFPKVYNKYSWRHLTRLFIKKVDMGYIRRARDFNILGRIARLCIEYQSDQLFETVFKKMVKIEHYTPRDAAKDVDRELGYKLETSFVRLCREFLESLKSYRKERPDIVSMSPNTIRILEDIKSKLEEIFSQKTLA
jgi:ParB/RepB/Spo0J family partition protein